MENEMKAIPRRNMWIVDVRDVASAHVTAVTLPEAAGMYHQFTIGSWM